MTYRVQVYGNDVGGIGGDVDFDEIATLDEARDVARREHPRGARPTEIYDEETETLVEEYDR